MKKAFKYIFLLSISLLFAVAMLAQGLPSAPQNTSVKNGILPNGMAYYLVTNPTTKGMADFALVQRTGTNILGQDAYDIARDALTSLPRLYESPQSFLAAHSVSPGKQGYVKVTENATLYHFDNVILTDESIDSLLLVMVDVVDRGTSQKDSHWDWYTPADHAVIVSGDIDESTFAMKLQMLSYMVPHRTSQERNICVWEGRETPEYKVLTDAKGKYATVSASWELPRTPEKYMNTVQPAIYAMYVNELGLLAQERISQQMRNDNVPVASVTYEYVSSQKSFGPEHFTISVTVAPEHIAQAVEVMASTMSSLDAKTVTVDEFQMAKRRYLANLGKTARKVMKSNSDYVEQCASAFLYNASLLSAEDIYPFLKYRDVDALKEIGYFNNITSAILDGQKNLTVRCLTDNSSQVSETELECLFQEAWKSTEPAFVCAEILDSLPSVAPVESIKLKSVKKDPVSGGVMWTFSNGFKVVYKKQKADRKMYYALALNGGYGNIRGIFKGEGAYVSDYLTLSKIADVEGAAFHRALEKYDITLTPTVNLSNTIISGYAPQDESEKLLQVLAAFVNKREADLKAFDYYKDCQNVSTECYGVEEPDRTIAIDSLLWPDYRLSESKILGNVSADFPSKVEDFWKQQAGKTNDGVLVLVGNLDEVKLKKLLQSHVGAFTTTDRVYPRLHLSQQPLAGAMTYTNKGEVNSVDFTMTARFPFTAENYMASDIAASVLEQLVSKAVSGIGMYLKLSHECRIYPHERLNVRITLEEADTLGFAHGIQPVGPASAAEILRETLAALPGMEISEDDIQKYKDILKGHLAFKMKDPQYWIQVIAMRHLDGKDLTTSYESRIDGVTPAKVKAILKLLSEASRVEYIIEK